MALPDQFEGEDVIMVLQEESSSSVINFEGRVLSWNISGGASSTDEVFAFGGKTFNFQKPREKFTAAFELMINNSDFDFVQFGGESGSRIGGAVGKTIKSTDTTRRWRIIMWFQQKEYHVTNSTKTFTVPDKTQSVYRMIFVDCKAVSFDKEFSADDYFKGTLTFEFSSADDKGYANMIEQEGIYSGTTIEQCKHRPSQRPMARSPITYSQKGFWQGNLLLWRVYQPPLCRRPVPCHR